MHPFRWASHHVRSVILIVGALCLLGLYISTHLPVSIFPDLTVPRIIIAAEGGDAPSQTILVTVTRPIEQAVSAVPGLLLVQSQTVRGSAGFTLTFEDGTDMNTALQLVQARLAELRSSLPADVDVIAERLNPTVFPILDYSLTSKTRSLADLRTMALYQIRPRLARVRGVVRVLVNGGDVLQFEVTVRPDKLAAYGLSADQVATAVTQANQINATGAYNHQYVRHLVLVSGLLQDVDSIRRVVVAVKNHVPVTVGDVAEVSEGIQRRRVIATGSGRPAVLLNIVRQPTGNTIQVAQDVHKEILSLKRQLPPDVTLTPFYDQSQIVRESESSVIEAISIGGLLALIVVSLFLRNVRSAFVALIMLPLTLLIAFVALQLLGMSLNIMTLGAIAIALGLVIDDAIVVVEHIFHRLEVGDSRAVAVRTALEEITPAMIASSASTIVTFLPLILLPGITGNFFAPMAKTMIAILLISLGLSLTIVPVMATWLFPRTVPHRHGPTESEWSQEAQRPGYSLHGRGVVRIYDWLARFALGRRAAVLLMTIPLAIGAAMLYNRLETGFMPEFDEGAFVMDYYMPAGTSLEETDRVMRQAEQILSRIKGVQSWSRLSGAQSGSGLEITPVNQGDLLVRLTRGNRPSADDIMNELRDKVQAAVPNVHIEMAAILGDLIGDLAGSPSPIEVKVFGPDMNVLIPLAREVGRRVRSIHGVVDESDGIIMSGPETVAQVDPVRAAQLGFTAADVTTALEAAQKGIPAGNVQRGEILEPILVRYPFQLRGSAVELAAMQLISPAGLIAPLDSMATIRTDNGTPQINRENQRQMVSVTARLEGIDLGSAVKAVQRKLASTPLPPGYSIEYGGLYLSQQQSFAALEAVLFSAATLVFAVLVLTFRSFRVAISLFVAAVLSLFGVLLALYLTGTPLNISSYTGAIMIVGIVTENGVLLFDELQRLQRDRPGARLTELLRQAGRLRLRPILMTTCAAILSLFPLSLGLGAGAAMQKPLAIAVIGGLALSTLFTLLVAPVLYASLSSLVDRLPSRMRLADETQE